MLDTTYSVETPEGVDIDLRVAGPVARFTAWGIDLGIRILIVLATVIPLSLLGKVGWSALLIVLFLVEWAYPILFEVLADGSTPGKKAMRLQVVHRDGTPVGWAASVARNILRSADMLPFPYGFGLVAMLFTPGFQRLGDLAAGTLVIYRDTLRAAAQLPSVTPVPPPVSLQLEEQRAVISFGQRAPRLAAARATELAAVAEPLVRAQPGAEHDPTRSLLGIAGWLAGRRAPE